MQRISVVLLLFVLIYGIAQAKAKPPQACALPKTAPPLTTAEKVAIESQEQEKMKANQQFNAAAQMEATIENEFAAAHPGWHIDPKTFIVEEDAPKPDKKK